MKKLINAVDDVVREQLQGMAAAHPELLVHLDPHYVCRRDIPEGKVAVVSGGGSGHEPMHGGFVGHGMLDGACPGEVFTSPTPDQMYECAKAVDRGAGVLFIVKNYTGDVMNFETAAELCHADGIKVQNILIDDDVAVKDSLYTAGRRGVGTTVLAEKIVGAAAEAGYSLEQCADLCRRVNSCSSMQTADELTTIVAQGILDDPAYTRTVRELNHNTGQWEDKKLTDEPFAKGDRVIAFVNSMGGTPVSELYAVYRKLDAICRDRGIVIERNLIGPYITSLEMQGFSITLLKVDDEMLKFWDAGANTPGFVKI
jgi:dihydroxyacetone kinase-like protein